MDTTQLASPVVADQSYCCSTLVTTDLTIKIQAWIAAREAEGWKVGFTIREEGGKLGVMWQCLSNPARPYQEFTPCISMAGREFRMN